MDEIASRLIIQSGFLLGFNFLEGSIPVKQNLIFLFAEVIFFFLVSMYSHFLLHSFVKGLLNFRSS